MITLSSKIVKGSGQHHGPSCLQAPLLERMMTRPWISLGTAYVPYLVKPKRTVKPTNLEKRAYIPAPPKGLLLDGKPIVREVYKPVELMFLCCAAMWCQSRSKQAQKPANSFDKLVGHFLQSLSEKLLENGPHQSSKPSSASFVSSRAITRGIMRQRVATTKGTSPNVGH